MPLRLRDGERDGSCDQAKLRMWSFGKEDKEVERDSTRALRVTLRTGEEVKEYCFKCCGMAMFGKPDYFCTEAFKFLGRGTGELPAGSVRFLSPTWINNSVDSRCGKPKSRCDQTVEFLCNLEHAKIMAQIANGTLDWHIDQVPSPSLVIAAIKKDDWSAAATD